MGPLANINLYLGYTFLNVKTFLCDSSVYYCLNIFSLWEKYVHNKGLADSTVYFL